MTEQRDGTEEDEPIDPGNVSLPEATTEQLIAELMTRCPVMMVAYANGTEITVACNQPLACIPMAQHIANQLWRQVGAGEDDPDEPSWSENDG